MNRSEILNATDRQLTEQVEIRQGELEETTAAMQETEKNVERHEAEVSKIRENIARLQALNAQMQQHQQGHGQ